MVYLVGTRTFAVGNEFSFGDIAVGTAFGAYVGLTKIYLSI
jgi:hypothetical protein